MRPRPSACVSVMKYNQLPSPRSPPLPLHHISSCFLDNRLAEVVIEYWKYGVAGDIKHRLLDECSEEDTTLPYC